MKTLSLLRSNRIVLALLLVITALFALPGSPAHAQGPDGRGKVVVGGSYTLPSGQTLNGDLAVFGGNATVEAGALVEGSVSVFGGNVVVDGRVMRDAVAIGGTLRLGPTAVIEGDAATVGGTLDKHPDAIIHGNTVTGPRIGGDRGIDIPQFPPLPSWPRSLRTNAPWPGLGNFISNFFLSGLSALFWASILAVLGVLMVMFIPHPAGRVLNHASRNLLTSFVAGLLTLVISAPVAVILAITICLSPLAVALIIIIGIALLYGWLVVGWLFGQKLLRALNARQTTPIAEVVVGVALLTLLTRLPGAIPCIGWAFSFGMGLIVGCTGLGAVILSRFGKQPGPTNLQPGPNLPAPPPPPPLPIIPPDLVPDSHPTLPPPNDSEPLSN